MLYRIRNAGILLLALSLWICAGSVLAQSVPAPAGLINWWKGEGNAYDIIGGHDGQLFNHVTFAPGKVGQAFHFDGISAYASMAQSIPSGPFTVELWMRTETAPGRLAVPISQGHSDGTGFVLQFWSWGAPYLGVGGLGNPHTLSSYPVSDLNWHHVAVTHDASNINRVYLDGVNVLVRETTPGPTYGPAQLSYSASFVPSFYGLVFGQDYANGGRFWQGLLDEVSIYNRALTGDEIQAIFNAGDAGKTYPHFGQPELLLADFSQSSILHWDANTSQFLGALVPNGRGGINTVHRALIGPNGDIFTDNHLTGEIKRFNGTTGEYLGNFALASGGPEDMVFGPNGDLYVSAFFDGHILRFDGQTGAPKPGPGLPGAIFVPAGTAGLGNPRGLTFDARGRLYVSNDGTYGVLRFNGASGALIDAFVPSGSGGLNYPLGLTFGPDGNLYVASSGSYSVLKYDGVTGAYLGVLVAPGSGGLASPHGISFGPDGNLYVRDYTNPSRNAVKRYNGATGAYMDDFIPAGSGGLINFAYLTFRYFDYQAPVTQASPSPMKAQTT